LEHCILISGSIPTPSVGVLLSSAGLLAVYGEVYPQGPPVLIPVASQQSSLSHLPPIEIAGPGTSLPKELIESATNVSASYWWNGTTSRVASAGQNIVPSSTQRHAIVSGEANSGNPPKGDFERMARRRFQNPKPKRRGEWWTLRVWKPTVINGQLNRTRERVRLAPATMSVREVQKVAAEYLRPLNQGFESIGSATNFNHYVETTYIPVVMPSMAKSTQDRYKGVIRNYLIPAFGNLCLRDLSRLNVQRYFSEMANSVLAHESKDKIKDVLSSILGSAVQFELLTKNPVVSIRLPAQRTGRKRSKPYITPRQFDELVARIPEPYASMIFVAVYTGLRVSEIAGLKWNDVHVIEQVNGNGEAEVRYSISIDERFCRGDWGAPKSDASNATIGINACVYLRIQRLKLLTVAVRAGTGTRRYQVVKSDNPEDLVFQSVSKGAPMRDNNILSRHIKPAARKMGLGFVNWRCLRTSHATWLKMAGADVKDAQAQMRHSRSSTTLDIYQQFVPESQQRAVEKLSSLSKRVQ
jgi:integrase